MHITVIPYHRCPCNNFIYPLLYSIYVVGIKDTTLLQGLGNTCMAGFFLCGFHDIRSLSKEQIPFLQCSSVYPRANGRVCILI